MSRVKMDENNNEVLVRRLDSAHQTLSAIKSKIETPPPGDVSPGEWVKTILGDIVSACDAELNNTALVLETPEAVIEQG